MSGGAWVEGWGQGAFPRSLPPHRPGAVGALTGLLSEAECGQAQEGEEHGGPHGAAAAAWTRPASAGPRPRLYSGLRPGGQECLPRLFGGHPPQLCRPNPKGCCGWSRSSLGRPLGVAGEEGVPGPSEGAAAGPPAPTHSPLEPLPQPQFELCLDSQEGCGGRKGPGGHSKSGRSGRQAATPTVGRGQEPNPGGGAGHALIHPARGQRQAGQARPNPGQACVSGRKGQGAQPGTEHQQRWGWARPPASAVGTLALPPHRASEGKDVERTCGLLSPVFPALAAPRWGRPSGPTLPGTGHPA